MATMAVEATYADHSGNLITKVFEGKGTTKKGVIEFLRDMRYEVSPKNVKIVTKARWS